MKRVHLLEITRPCIEVECKDHFIRSDAIFDYKKHSNFSRMVQYLDIDLADQEDYFPPLTIKLLSSSGFGRIDIVATHVVASLQTYSFRGQIHSSSHEVVQIELDENPDSYYIQKITFPWTLNNVVKNTENEEEEEENIDWWARFYISMNLCFLSEETQSFDRKSGEGITKKPLELNKASRLSSFSQHVFRVAALDNGFQKPILNSQNARAFTVYDCELENVAEFGGLKQWLHSFDLKRGKRFSRLKDNIIAIFKGCFRVYKLPLPPRAFDYELGLPGTVNGFFENVPLNNPVKVLVRAYFIQAMGLQPSDFTNTTDAYIVLRMEKHKISNRSHYVSKLLNPVFGECFEFVASFPAESILNIQVCDWDLMGSDDLIGETTIDLENRFYSKHRATCGLPRFYEKEGANAWRDALTPLEILKVQCQRNQLNGPHIRDCEIRIGNRIFEFDNALMGKDGNLENFALCLLHRWGEICPKNGCLVPEHVETRTLYHPKRSGKSQGRLLMWLDMFAEDQTPSSDPREVAKRRPDSYELRVIIWNTDSVKLADDAFLTGEKMSDIYVKGWLTGKDVQTTDVHYRSLTGEGNFNWRFIFPFDYLATERQIMVMRKMHVLSIDETEYKLAAYLHLEAWDADRFSSDDPLGALTINLNRVPRGARTAKLCNLSILQDATTPKVSLFKQKRVKGWWPLTESLRDGKREQTGKIEIELLLLTAEEAQNSPAGLGRKEPDALPEPKRPETSFINFVHPLKTFRYAFWKRYKWGTVKFLIIGTLILLIVLFFFAIPGYAVKRLLGV
ncbi:otoferlin [Parasteatoda tepidariorum]|uniref:otoferlin n=1 Tax=Parasteatoda tepidariorum TaxID=114398 RepID=UPI0039BCF967